ncbi:MAG: DUF2933 domain-containing protein [Synergistaceae bacterium]|nr:DUF2933 domain-containing protein [Synergistaceae bacterium]
MSICVAVPVLLLVSLFIIRPNSGGLLSYVFFLLCPLAHLFMMFALKDTSKKEGTGKNSCH